MGIKDNKPLHKWYLCGYTVYKAFNFQTGAAAVAAALPKPKSMVRPRHWSEEVEEAYRFQLAGYRDRNEYLAIKGEDGVSIKKKFHGFMSYINFLPKLYDKKM